MILPRSSVLSALLTVVMVASSAARDLPELAATHRRGLALHPEQPLAFQRIADGKPYEPTPERPAHFNIRRVYLANAARDRWVFAITFAAPYTFDNTHFILYVDADNDPTTGRPGMGCETTYGHSNGRPTQMLYVDDSARKHYPGPRVALVDGVLFISADVRLEQQDGRSMFRITALSEQANPHEGRDNLGWRQVTGPANSDIEPLLTLAEREGTEGFLVTQSMPFLWEMQADSGNLVINSYRDCAFEGFIYNHTEYRWPSLRRSATEGTITAPLGRSGRFHLGVVVYDGAGIENYEVELNGEPVGFFSAAEQNRRQRLFFTEKAFAIQAGNTLTLRAASTVGDCIVEDIVLLARRPPVLEPPRRIENLEVGWDWDRGTLRATWTTTWPTVCRVVYDGGTIEGSEALQNHRVHLSGLAEGQRGRLRIAAQLPNGETLRSAPVRFAAVPPALPRGNVARERIPLSILTTDVVPPPGYPLTAGIPFERGALGDTANLRLVDAAGGELPLQARALVRWPDHSVKVALIDTVVPAEGTDADLVLEYGYRVVRTLVSGGISIADDGTTLRVSTPMLRMEFDRAASGLFTRMWHDPTGHFGPETLLTQPEQPVRVVLTDDAGRAYDTLGAPDRATIEEAGALRTVVRLEGHHSSEHGELFTYRVRVTFHAHTPGVILSYRFGNDHAGDEFALLRGIRLELPLAAANDPVVVLGADEPVATTAVQAPRLEQLQDDRHTAGTYRGKRAPGWMLLGQDARQLALVPRHFWQLYPKAIGVADGMPYYDVAPVLPEDLYADASTFDVIKLFFYLQDGHYKFRQGMTKVHDLWLLFPDTEPLDTATVQAAAERVNQPPVLAASPEHYARSGVFGRFVTRTSGRTPRYDQVSDRVYNSSIAHRNSTRAFGMLNFGDQFGERRLNWSNGEYDHHFGAAQMFVRGAEPRWFHLMREIARHDIDVDHCHYHTNPHFRGAKWVHAMGHTGRYFTRQFDPDKNEWVTERPQYAHLVGWGLPHGGVTPCHSWTEGTCLYYLLTGDPTAIETARMLNDRYAGTYLNHWDFRNGRDVGWPLIFTMATYRTTYDPYYLNAARLIIERVFERRTPGGGWDRQMVPGHCFCEPRCRGSAGFMQGVLAVGLREYYQEIGDRRVEEAIVDAARVVIRDMWREDSEGWTYTSCPDMTPHPGRAPVMAPLVLFAWELSQDPKLLDIAVRSMNPGFEHLGSFSYLRWTPYIVTVLDRVGHEVPGFGGGPQGATVLVRNEQTYPLEVRVFSRDGRPAPPEAAELSGPTLDPVRPDEDGRLRVPSPQPGVYTLRMAPESGPWQLTSNANRMVMGLREGLDVELAEAPAHLFIAPVDQNTEVRVALESARGRVRARLLSPSGRELARSSGRRITLAARATEQGLHEVVVNGPGQVRMRAEGCGPWTAVSARRYFNASAPSVTIEGARTIHPGQDRRVRLRAVIHDPEDDVVAVRWKLPDGHVVEGPELSWRPAEGTNLPIEVVAADAAGNEGRANVEVRLPPPELDTGGRAVTVRAVNFSGQGEGRVISPRRIGATDPIITQWHANEGHWLEWTFTVPAAGKYHLVLRYATDSAPARRSLTLNGSSPGTEYDTIEFPATGGYSSSTDNWQFKCIAPALLLQSGTQKLRLTNLGGGLAVDYLTLVEVTH